MDDNTNSAPLDDQVRVLREQLTRMQRESNEALESHRRLKDAFRTKGIENAALIKSLSAVWDNVELLRAVSRSAQVLVDFIVKKHGIVSLDGLTCPHTRKLALELRKFYAPAVCGDAKD